MYLPCPQKEYEEAVDVFSGEQCFELLGSRKSIWYLAMVSVHDALILLVAYFSWKYLVVTVVAEVQVQHDLLCVLT